MFSSSRLVIARHRRGLSKTELAAKTSISARAIRDYEAGSSSPEPWNVAALARALDFPIEFFSAPDIEEPTPDAASFRAMSRVTARQRDSALAAGALAIEFACWIDHRFELPKPDLPDLGGMEPEAAAHALRQLWALGEKPIRNMIHLLEHHGVRVFSLAEQCREIDAFSMWRDGVPYVFFNTQKSVEHSRFDAAHELGHLLLHRHAHSGCDAGDLLDDGVDELAPPPVIGRTLENEANLFASAFLMPRASMLSTIPIAPDLDHLMGFKKAWRVSLAALVHRIHRLDIISSWQYRNLCIDLSRLGYRTREPEGLEARETSQVLAKVFAELRSSGTTRNDVARSLRVSTRELDVMIFGLALSAVEGGDESPRLAARGHLRLVE